jgi:hypothetical protein
MWSSTPTTDCLDLTVGLFDPSLEVLGLGADMDARGRGHLGTPLSVFLMLP